MNLTISVDEKLLERARAVARQRGTSLNTLLRQYLESLAGAVPGQRTADELIALMTEHGGRSGGAPFRREDAYEGRV